VNARAMLLSVITGLGHWAMGYRIMGALLLSLFLIGLNGVFLGTVLLSYPQVKQVLLWTCGPGVAALWLFGIIHIYLITYGRDREALREERRVLLQEGLLGYLRGDLGRARKALKRAVKLDYDWEEPHLQFHFGVVELRLAKVLDAAGRSAKAGRRRRAGLQAFRRCLARDPAAKWLGEIEIECRRAGLKPPMASHQSKARAGAGPPSLQESRT